MQIDYKELTKLVNIRQSQIEDISLERDYFNTEYTVLEEIKQQLAKLLILERKQENRFNEVPLVGNDDICTQEN